jgi:hypothetical protein
VGDREAWAMDAMHICLIMGATTVSIKVLSIMTFSLTTLSITKKCDGAQPNKNQRND